jgi:D-2-hydroxyacid dehydrogenase (NADP+)
MESTFSKMKKSAVFLNIGRGTTVNEDDLVKALNEEMIAGAVLDVYKQEPLPETSNLWEAKNMYLNPHCSGQDLGNIPRSLINFADNLKNFSEGGVDKLQKKCDKVSGY